MSTSTSPAAATHASSGQQLDAAQSAVCLIAQGTNGPAERDRFALLGVYGFSRLQILLLTALVTEDPLLLIGKSGTGKTYLLNRISEALRLEHRHYNASLISFDDLVGFPYPNDAKTCIEYLQTPASAWGAESVLIDEISRCKPEHQNRFFSLVHERRIQGILLARLRYRWCAMNPCRPDQDGDDYAGSEPLDPALADRFGLLVQVGDWLQLTAEERRMVADPAELHLEEHVSALRSDIARWRKEFLDRLQACPPEILDYATAAVTVLNQAGIRMSPRRSQLLCRSLLAASVVCGEHREEVFQRVLGCSIPHTAWGERISDESIAAAHATAWECSRPGGTARWLHELHSQPRLAHKLARLLRHAPDRDTAATALAELLAREAPERAAVLAFALYPAALNGRVELTAECLNDLGKLAGEVLAGSGPVARGPAARPTGSVRSERTTCEKILGRLKGRRREQARQLFRWAEARGIALQDPRQIEGELEECVQLVREVTR